MAFFDKENPIFRTAVVVITFLLMGMFGFFIGYVIRGNSGPAQITIEKCSVRQ